MRGEGETAGRGTEADAPRRRWLPTTRRWRGYGNTWAPRPDRRRADRVGWVYYDPSHTPITEEQADGLLRRHGHRRPVVARDVFADPGGGVGLVSTVFTVLDMAFGADPDGPVLYETAVFDGGGEQVCQHHWHTRGEALADHDRTLAYAYQVAAGGSRREERLWCPWRPAQPARS